MHMVEEYVNASQLQYEGVLDVIEEFGKEISEMRGKCIDIGCGPGNFTKTLILPNLAPEAELVGADISKNMVDYASKTYTNEKRLSFICLDVETANLPNDLVNQFSNVLSFHCLQWCQNPWRSFENIWKMLQPGGTALTVFVSYHTVYEVYIKLSENPLYRRYMKDVDRVVPYYQRCKNRRSSFRDLLEDTGFEVLHCSKRQKNFFYQNVQSLKDHMEAVNPFLNRLPEDLREQFMEDTIQEMGKRNIFFQQQNGCTNQEYKVLDIYETLVAYVRKPLHA